MNGFEITLISGTRRVVRKVIAQSSTTATRIAMDYMPSTTEPMAIICKPALRLPKRPEWRPS